MNGRAAATTRSTEATVVARVLERLDSRRGVLGLGEARGQTGLHAGERRREAAVAEGHGDRQVPGVITGGCELEVGLPG
jgi:hypothetical protein